MTQRLVPQSVLSSTSTRGRIVTAQPIDREEIALYQLSLIAEDVSDSPLSESIPVMISVLDVNDNFPLFDEPSWNLTVTENTEDLFIMEFNVSRDGHTYDSAPPLKVTFMNPRCMQMKCDVIIDAELLSSHAGHR